MSVVALLVAAGLGAACGGGEAAKGVASTPGAAAGAALAQGEHRFVANGLELVAHVAGTGPVMIAHPGGPGAEWSYLRMPEVERSFTVVYLEPLGTGASGRPASPAEYTIDRYVADIEALRESLGQERVYLLGHSHGGFVAQAYAIAHSDHLLGLVLYDTSPTTGPEWQKDIGHNLHWFEREPWFADAQRALAEETSATTDQQMTAIFHREGPLYFGHYTERRAELEPMIRAMRFSVAPSRGGTDPGAPKEVGVAPAFDVRADLPKIRARTLIVVGRRDFVCSLEMARIMAAGIPDSTLVILEKSGHMGHVEEPQAFADAVAGFAAK
ncbi:MAG TPA: alpha/beta hydrolase [Kofleriaceae bacterium]|nr:alpha/beta hydrolase [Kofleriaceae bacterium]